MSRESFLARVRSAAAAGRAYRVRLRGDLPAGAGYSGAGEDPVGRMAAEVDAAGGSAHVARDLEGARAVLAALLDQYGPRSALCWRHPLLERLGLGELLASRGIAVWDYESLGPLSRDEQRSSMLAADIGISSVSLAVAETGTLALASAGGQERAASLLPPIHVAVVAAREIVPDLFDLFERLAAEARRPGEEVRCEADATAWLASNLVLVTGPSKTGDLELKLTTGVHGPGQLHVVIIREASEG